MAAVSEIKIAKKKALVVASGSVMLEKMVRPLQEAGLRVDTCGGFMEARALFRDQALLVVPTEGDEQTEGFLDWLRQQRDPSPYIVGVGGGGAAVGEGIVARLGLDDFITFPLEEETVLECLGSFRLWCGSTEAMDESEDRFTPAMQDPGQADPLQTTRGSFFPGSQQKGKEEETPEAIYCREAPMGIAMFDRDLRYILANPRWIQQFRLGDKEVIGKSQFEVLPKLHPNWKNIYESCLNGETRRGRESVASAHGPVEMLWEVRPWRHLAGQIGGLTIAFEGEWRSPRETGTGAASGQPNSEISMPAKLNGPALLVDLNGNVIEANDAARALGADQLEAEFVEALRRDADSLAMTDLAPHDDPASGATGSIAWSNTILRDAEGKAEKVLRLGAFLPEDLLPRTGETAAQAMSKDEIGLRTLWRESSLGFALIDRGDKIHDINPALERILGVAREQLLGRSFDQWIHAEDLSGKRVAAEQLLDSPEHRATVELRLAGCAPASDDGREEERWARLHISVVRGVDQGVLFSAYFIEDLTDQKRVEAELQISQEQNRALLEVIPHLILLVNRDGQVIDLMPGESVPADWAGDAAIGQSIYEIIPALKGKLKDLMSQAYELEDVIRFQFTSEMSQDRFEARIVACKPDNVIITIQVLRPPSTEDPADGLNAARLQWLSFFNSPDAVVVTDDRGTILDWNPAAETLFGYSAHDARGQSLPHLFGVDTVESLTQHLRPGEGNGWEGRLAFRGKDRLQGTAEVTLLPLKPEVGSRAGRVAFIREARTGEEARWREGLVAEIRKESLAKLAPQLHQRLRNNLQIIGTLTNLQIKEQREESAREALQTSRDRTRALSILHEQIGAQGDMDEIDFRRFAQELADHLLRSYGSSARVRVQFAIEDALDLQVASPLSLILNELLSNAIRHGFPEPETGSVLVSLKLTGRRGRLTVSDDGIGVEPSEATGMGLQIARTLARQIGGTVERTDSRETEFRVYFTASPGR